MDLKTTFRSSVACAIALVGCAGKQPELQQPPGPFYCECREIWCQVCYDLKTTRDKSWCEELGFGYRWQPGKGNVFDATLSSFD